MPDMHNFDQLNDAHFASSTTADVHRSERPEGFTHRYGSLLFPK